LQPIGFAALGVVTVASILLFVVGRRFTRTYVAKHNAMPPMTWMFRDTGDPDLEAHRRLALTTLPFYLVALAIYLFAQQQV
jgi:hypothetical protein